MEQDWNAIHAQSHSQMLRAAGKVLTKFGRADLIEDAVQQAFCSVLEKPPKPPPDSWTAYLTRIAHDKAVDIGNNIVHTRRLSERSLQRGDVDDVAETVTDKISRERMLAALPVALTTLPCRNRAILIAVFINGRKQADLAAEFQLSKGRISQITSAALRNLRQTLSETR
jgi:RNA polymerase sigma factor (sigma-70 family)